MAKTYYVTCVLPDGEYTYTVTPPLRVATEQYLRSQGASLATAPYEATCYCAWKAMRHASDTSLPYREWLNQLIDVSDSVDEEEDEESFQS